MAPGRRRGANKAKNATGLTFGDLVLAKVKGFPPWPAKVSRPEDCGRTSDPKKYFVQFFGTQEVAFVAPPNIELFTSDLRKKLFSRCKGKTVKFFAQAVYEISDAFEELDRNKAGDSGGYLLEHCTNVQESTNDIETKPDACPELVDDENKCEEQRVIREASHCKEEPTDIKNMDETSLYNERTLSTKGTSSSPSCTGSSTVGGKQRTPRDCHDWKGSKNDSKRRVQNDVTHSEISHAFTKNATLHYRKDLVCSSIEPAVAAYPKEEKNGHLSLKRHKIADTERPDPVKRSKHPTSGSNSTRSCSNNDEKQLSNLSSPAETVERNSVSMKDGGLCGLQPKHGAGSSSLSGHEISSPLGKRHFGSSEEKKGSFSAICKTDIVKKRRAVRFYDDGDDDVPKTPVHGVSSALSLKVSLLGLDSKSNGRVPLKSAAHDSEGTGRTEDASPHKARKEDASLHKARKEDAFLLKARKDGASPLKGGREGASPLRGGREGASPLKVGIDDAFPHKARKEDAFPHKARKDGASPLKGGREGASPLKGGREGASPLRGGREGALPLKVGIDDAFPHKAKREDVSPDNESDYSKLHEESSPIPVQHGVDKSNKEEGSQITVGLDSKGELSDKSNADILSPGTKVCVAAGSRLEEQSGCKSLLREPGVGGQTKSHMPSDKLNQPKKVKQVSPQERPKVKSMTVKDGGSVANSRAEDTEIGKCISSGDTKATDSAASIKSLIAAAQAKRRQAQNTISSQGNLIQELPASDDIQRKYPSPITTGLQFLADSSNSKQIDAVGIPTQMSIVSPSGHAHGSEDEERKPDVGYQSGSSSLSGGTEAAVARDAFEGMIETLSRTKESIGRATRLAVDCAKYGIANEVVDLLVRKLETEASFHRKVDLFFLVDSITQCSHNQKGIAGALYIPAIEGALPRLLGAAAPPGVNARENRRQCHKVLRLWLERRILPESVLKRFMDDLGTSHSEVKTSLSSRRPSRAERTVDDPIRGMEGMLVDEYGSNATFELPGFFLSRAFDDDEDEAEGVPSASKELARVSLLGSTETILQLGGVPALSDRSHHILEDVDGELEMEDISEIQKGQVDSYTSGISGMRDHDHGHGLFQDICRSTSEEEEALTPEGSPPLPHEPPPLLPPLPSSPPPPLPPSSPPPLPPPPPPPLQHRASSVLSAVSEPPALHPSLPPHPHFPSQVLLQAHFPPSPSLQLTYPRPVPPEFSNRGNHNTGVTGNCQQQSTFLPAAASGPRNPASQLEYGKHDMFTNSQSNQHGQHLQPNYTLQSHGPFHQPPPLPAQTPSSQFSFSKPSVQQHLQPPYPSSYPSVSFLDNRASCDPDARLKSSAEYKLGSQLGAWINVGRVPPLATPFVADGYYPPPPDRSAANNAGFHHSNSTPNSVPAGYTNHTNGQIFPSRPDISTLNCWRPA